MLERRPLTKIMKNLLLTTCICLLLTSCLPPNNPDYWLESKRNACFLASITYNESLKKYDVWSEVVVCKFVNTKTNKTLNHSFTVFVYPKGSTNLWTYDNFGTYQIKADKINPLDIAQKAIDARTYHNYVIFAKFLK